MENPWKVELYRSWDEVDSPGFAEQLRQWMEHAPDAHVFYHPVILKAWTDTMRKLQNVTPLYVVARYEEITFFLPLILWKRNWKNAFLRVIIPAGFSDFDYHDPGVSGPHTNVMMASFWTLFRQEVIDSGRIGYDKVDLNGIRSPGLQRLLEREEACPYIELNRYDNFEDYLASRSKSLRKDIRRKKRILEDAGELEYHVYGPHELENALPSFSLFLDTHSRQWPHAFKAPGLHEALLRNCLPKGLLHFSEIRIDGVPVSWEIGFRERQRAYSYMPAYLDEYAGMSPGKVHLSFLTEECFKSDRRIFDHLRGSETYKAGWADHIAEIYAYTKDASNLQARMRQAGFGAMQELKNIRRSIR